MALPVRTAPPAPTMTRPGVAPAPDARPEAAPGRAVEGTARGARLTSGLGAVARTLLHTIWPIALVVAIWQAWVVLGDVPPAVAPHPAQVFAYIADDPASFLVDARDTLVIVLGGLVLGAVAGALLAALSWASTIARATISGPAMVTQCLPIATIVPVVARVLGYNTWTITVIAALIAFFPVLVFTTTGLRATPPGSDDLFVVLGGSRWQRFWRLAAPSAVPRLLIALRLTVVAAVVGAMLAQWIMGTAGLGYRLVVAQVSFRTSEAWAASLVAIVLSVVLYSVVAALCRIAQRRFE